MISKVLENYVYQLQKLHEEVKTSWKKIKKNLPKNQKRVGEKFDILLNLVNIQHELLGQELPNVKNQITARDETITKLVLKLQVASNNLTTKNPSVQVDANVQNEGSPRCSFQKNVSKIQIPRQQQKQKTLRRTVSYTFGCDLSNRLPVTGNWHDIEEVRSMEREMNDELNRLSEKSLNLSLSSSKFKTPEAQTNINNFEFSDKSIDILKKKKKKFLFEIKSDRIKQNQRKINSISDKSVYVSNCFPKDENQCDEKENLSEIENLSRTQQIEESQPSLFRPGEERNWNETVTNDLEDEMLKEIARLTCLPMGLSPKQMSSQTNLVYNDLKETKYNNLYDNTDNDSIFEDNSSTYYANSGSETDSDLVHGI